MSSPKISVIVVVYDMEREAPKTLRSLAPGYQYMVDENDYEVIVIDNGSPTPLGKEVVESFGSNFRYFYIEDAHPSPASAINFGVKQSDAEIVGIMIDGARMLTPGVIRHVKSAHRAYDNAVVATLGWHLGPEQQQVSVRKGYNKDFEDKLLKKIDWPYYGYDLFSIAALGASSSRGCWAAPAESNAVFVKRTLFDEVGGFDERFDTPGGGIVNLDFFKLVCDHPSTELVMLAGEGNFHQLHGGTSTNQSKEDNQNNFKIWNEQFKSIRGKYWSNTTTDPVLFGNVNRVALPYLRHTASIEEKIWNADNLYRMDERNSAG